MRKKMLSVSFIIGTLALLGAGCARYSAPSPAAAPESGSGASAASAPTQPVTEAVIEYKDGVFNPATLKILAGTRVTFINKGAKEVWPASGVHPSHLLCPGFDALKTLKQGEKYSFTFTEAKDCPFHNNVAPSERGKIEVQAQ